MRTILLKTMSLAFVSPIGCSRHSRIEPYLLNKKGIASHRHLLWHTTPTRIPHSRRVRTNDWTASTTTPSPRAVTSKSTSPSTSKDGKKLAILVSGSGRSVENLCARIATGSLVRCHVAVVIASKKNAGALTRVEPYGVATRVVRMVDFEGDVERFSDGISDVLDEFHTDFVVMAGWMHFYRIPVRYSGRVINIHPSLIPAFCGKGYYGSRVHQAVLSAGVKVTGCTVHLADNEYDHGPIILQRAVSVKDSDDVDALAVRVFEEEKEALPEAVQLLVDGRIRVQDGVVRISDDVRACG